MLGDDFNKPKRKFPIKFPNKKSTTLKVIVKFAHRALHHITYG